MGAAPGLEDVGLDHQRHQAAHPRGMGLDPLGDGLGTQFLRRVGGHEREDVRGGDQAGRLAHLAKIPVGAGLPRDRCYRQNAIAGQARSYRGRGLAAN
ncbi:hypothetical protein D3C79_898960 [compost metagenome]